MLRPRGLSRRDLIDARSVHFRVSIQTPSSWVVHWRKRDCSFSVVGCSRLDQPAARRFSLVMAMYLFCHSNQLTRLRSRRLPSATGFRSLAVKKLVRAASIASARTCGILESFTGTPGLVFGAGRFSGQDRGPPVLGPGRAASESRCLLLTYDFHYHDGDARR